MRIVTRYGWLLGVVGSARCYEGIWLAPVRGDIEEPQRDLGYTLKTHKQAHFDCEGFELGDADGVWVRAAIPSVFGYTPLHVSDGRWFLLDAAFVAVVRENEESWTAYPFVCTDVHNATGLVFSKLGPAEELRERIAGAFWGLLLAEGAEHLSEFSAPGVGFDIGDGYDTELVVGYSRGRFFAEETRDFESDEEA